MINKAAVILDVSPDSLKPFSVEDPFNNGNVIEGFICHRTDHRYGALVIFSVNGEPCEQVIYGTPKMHYPFDKNGAFSWPKVTEIQAWEKLDGTNILAFHYRGNGNECLTYKTRLTPIVKDMQFGRFESMWRELLDTQPWINRAIADNADFNLSFELYGNRNPITVKYNRPLMTSLLFGVRRSDAAVKPPTELKNIGYDIPTRFDISSGEDLTSTYNALRDRFTNLNNQTEDLLYEGIVLYAHVGEASWRQFKCKPEQIEKIHWSNGGIPKNAIWTTAINVFENYDNPTISDLKTLLLEEFTDTQITKSWNKIERLFNEAFIHTRFVSQVNEAWAKAREMGFDVALDKGATMRFLSQYFTRNDMRRVGTIILKQAGLI